MHQVVLKAKEVGVVEIVCSKSKSSPYSAIRIVRVFTFLWNGKRKLETKTTRIPTTQSYVFFLYFNSLRTIFSITSKGTDIYSIYRVGHLTVYLIWHTNIHNRSLQPFSQDYWPSVFKLELSVISYLAILSFYSITKFSILSSLYAWAMLGFIEPTGNYTMRSI